MYPNTFLKSMWRSEILDQAFVAMSFEGRFEERYHTVIKPAIEGEAILGSTLRAYRVDNSKTGDSILSEIVDGIAHSRLVLADVSVIDEGRYTQVPMRNGNVMYEVGVALACRNPSDVLLVRDDAKAFIFDVSTIPHMTLDFSNRDAAITQLRSALADRISESKLLEDARVRVAAQALMQDEVRLLKRLAQLRPEETLDLAYPPTYTHLSLPDRLAVSALMSKGCVKSVAIKAEKGTVLFALTPFGYALALLIESELKKI
jgi:hypothetical protein